MSRLFLVLPLAALYAPAAFAAEGAVRGRVVDDAGLAVPDATIELSGTGIAGELQVQSDAEGYYRFVAVPVGTHTMRVTKSGLTPIRREVTVRLDQTASIDVVLKVAGSEELLIEEAEPVIDVTRSAVSTELSAEVLENLPVGRNTQDAVNMLPGVYGRVDTQNGGPGNGNPSVRGEGQYGNNYYLDGISTRDPATKTFGSSVNFDAIDDIQVYTDGAPAEFGQATGMMVNVVTKSGGDEHHGSVGYYLSKDFAFGTYAIADLATNQEVETEKRKFLNHELSLNAGGPIVKEKLWYFASADLGMGTTEFEGMDPDAPYLSKDGGGFAKLSWFIVPELTARYQFNAQVNNIDNYQTSAQFLPESQSQYRSRDMSHQLTMEWFPDAKTSFELRGLYQDGSIDVVPMSGDEETPAIFDYDSGVYTQNWTDFDYNRRGRLGGSLKATRLVDGFLGSHRFKGGAEFWRLTDSRELVYTGPGDGIQYFASEANGRPCTAGDGSDCFGYTEYEAAGAIGHVGQVYGFFLQDDWQPVEPLTMNLGVRLDHETLLGNEGQEILSQWMPAPRLGVAWDVTGDSKTLVSLNAGRFYDINGNTFADWGDTRSAFVYRQYQWDEAANDYVLVWEQNPETQPLVYCTESSLGDYEEHLAELGYVDEQIATERAAADELCGDGLKPYHMDKIVLGIQREILPLFAVGIRGIWSRTRNLPEDIDTNLTTWVIGNPETKKRDYWGVELTAHRQFDEHWQVLASYTYSQAKGTTPGQFEIASGGSTGSDGNQVGVYADDVNDLDTRAGYFDAGYGWLLDGLAGLGTLSDDAGYYGYLPYHSFHQAKVNGSYTFDFGTTIGAVYEFDSGHAWQKRGYVELYQDYFAFPEGRGTRFMPAVHYFDLRLAHHVDLGKGRAIDASVDVYNLFDLAQAITPYENDDANFGLTLYRQQPRSILAGLKVTY